MRRIHVAVGALEDERGRVLVAQRPLSGHLGGLWEFPGGKLEPGESIGEGLGRELREELGIQVHCSQPLIRIHHDYPDRQVLLDVHRITGFAGDPHGREGQAVRWLHPDDMDGREFPAADRPIINALRLPDRLLITGRDPHDRSEFLARLERALQRGNRLLQLRAPGLSAGDYSVLASEAAWRCRDSGAELLLNPPEGAWDRLLGDGVGDGLHLTARRLMSLQGRPEARYRWIGASCHNRAELDRAAELDLDYALLSPVKPTASHPDAKPLGWARFAELVDVATLPVYALGGMGPADIEIAKSYGGQGIAAISALWDEVSIGD